MKDNKQKNGGRFPRASNDGEEERTDIRSIMKEIELLSSTHMTWKEKKAVENRKVVSLGGKPQKQQRLPLSVAKGRMKKQQQREEQIQQERMILGCFGGKTSGGSRRSETKRQPQNRVLKATEGKFKNGVLDVKHLLHKTPSREFHMAPDMFSKGPGPAKGKGKGKNKGKKGGGKKRR